MARSIKRILVPIDFSESSSEAVELAITIARTFKARIELLHVFVEPVYALPAPIEVVTFPIDMERIYSEVERLLTRDRERVRAAEVDCESVTLTGRPHAEIVAYALKSEADLVVMGTHGRGGLGHAILGSVAERVVHKAPCPVLVVPMRKPATS
jgi:nucleotide-binding universal stress UspA family protein